MICEWNDEVMGRKLTAKLSGGKLNRFKARV